MGNPSAASKHESLLERHGPVGFVMVGLAMIVVAAAAGLNDAVAITFAILGVALVALGGLAARLEGPFEIGADGLKGVLRVRHDLLEAKHEAEHQGRPEDAKRLGEVVDELDDWFAMYLREDLSGPELNPFIRAARLQRAYDRRHRSSEQG